MNTTTVVIPTRPVADRPETHAYPGWSDPTWALFLPHKHLHAITLEPIGTWREAWEAYEYERADNVDEDWSITDEILSGLSDSGDPIEGYTNWLTGNF